jgi:predicted small secreted protein
MRLAFLAGLLLSTSLLAVRGPKAASEQGLPANLAGYRSWAKLTREAQLVPYELSILCASVKPRVEDLKKHGPHTNRWIMVYANSLAEAALRNQATVELPAGAILVKEKLRNPGASDTEGVAFMVKHVKGEFPASGGWEFLYYPPYQPDADTKPSYETCITCHRAGAAKDYVFGRYGGPGTAK